MRKASWLTASILTGLMALAPTTAWAGESQGPSGPGGATGGTTPVENFWSGGGAASICSFSGLNDVINAEEPTRTQSYGTFMVLIMQTAGVDAETAKAILGEAPADFCNPNNAPWGNPRR